MKRLTRLCELSPIVLSFALFVACSKPAPPAASNNSISNQPTPTPAVPQASGQSQNWKVAVLKAVRIHREDNSFNPLATKVKLDDMMELSMEVEYLGPTGKVAAPNVFIDNSGRRVKIEQASMEHERKGSLRNVEDAQEEFNLLAWLQNLKKPAPRNVTTGQKFQFSYQFTDPKADNLKLVFADVQPVVLPKPEYRDLSK